MIRRVATAAPVMVMVLAALAGCAGRPAPAATTPAPPLVPCTAVAAQREPPPGDRVPANDASLDGDVLAGVELACLAGGAPVALARLGRPAVVNLWASWCAPCRAELPELARFSTDAGARLVVLGVVSGDTAGAAAAAAVDFGVSFANVFDPDQSLLHALGRTALPLTLFVDPYGQVAHVYQGAPLSRQRLAELAARHLGVGVGS